MNIVLSATILSGIMTWLLIRSRSIRALEATIVGLFGFCLASSVLGAAIRAFLTALVGLNHAKTGVPLPEPLIPPAAASSAGLSGLPL